MLHRVMEPPEPQALDGASLVPREPYSALFPGYEYLGHAFSFPLGDDYRALGPVRPRSTTRWRLARSSSGSLRLDRPAIVAFTTFTGLVLRRTFVRISFTPANSTTALTEPPAITPVPGTAGFSINSIYIPIIYRYVHYAM